MSHWDPDKIRRHNDATAARELFLDELRSRLEKGAQDYGDESFGRPLHVTFEEIMQELLDVAGWAFVAREQMRARLQRVFEASEQAGGMARQHEGCKQLLADLDKLRRENADLRAKLAATEPAACNELRDALCAPTMAACVTSARELRAKMDRALEGVQKLEFALYDRPAGRNVSEHAVATIEALRAKLEAQRHNIPEYVLSEMRDLRAKLAATTESSEVAAPAQPADQHMPAEKPHGHEPEPARHATGPQPDPEVLRVPAPAAAPAGDQQAAGRPGGADGAEAPAVGGDERRPAQATGGEGLLRPRTFVAVCADGWIRRIENLLPGVIWRRATDEEIAFAPGDVPERERQAAVRRLREKAAKTNKPEVENG